MFVFYYTLKKIDPSKIVSQKFAEPSFETFRYTVRAVDAIDYNDDGNEDNDPAARVNIENNT